MRFSLIPLLLLCVPTVEIAAFIVVGQQIGLLPTLALILATAIAGSILLRVQGFGVLRRIRQTMETGQPPGRDLVHGAMILVAGVLLLLPGFVSDVLGFLLFIPQVRDLTWNLFKDRFLVIGTARRTGPSPYGRPRRTIDLNTGEYQETDPRSPWKQS